MSRFSPGDVLSYIELCLHEEASLQRGMNYRLHPEYSVVLMSVRSGAPYADRIENGGKTLIYEGHNEPQLHGGPDPKTLDQPLRHPGGSLTQNGLFFEAATSATRGERAPELVRVYEKVRKGIWVYNGPFRLAAAWTEQAGSRTVFRFRLELDDVPIKVETVEPEHSRVIPPVIKQAVWKRDGGRCVLCGSEKNLHFDHEVPYSKGGTSLVASNIRLLCATHNLRKRDRIE